MRLFCASVESETEVHTVSITYTECAPVTADESEVKSSQKSKSALLSILPHVPYIHTEN